MANHGVGFHRLRGGSTNQSKQGVIMKLKRIKAGLYEYKGYQIYRWWHEDTPRYALWCVALEGTGLDDFRTLAKAREYIDKGRG